jgi:NADH-quinone oxidoreductase subunit N
MIILLIFFGVLYTLIEFGEFRLIPEIIIKISNETSIITKGTIKITKNIILLIIFTILIIYTIFSLEGKIENKLDSLKNIKTIEYDLLIVIALLGLILMLLSDELFLLYLGIELFTFSTYFLILTKQTSTICRLSIIYLILSSIASILMLFSFNSLYSVFGTFNYSDIINFLNLLQTSYTNTYPSPDFAIWGIILSILFKLGTAPFLFWVVRLYCDLDKRILWFLVTIPKLILITILLKFIHLFSYHNSLDFNLPFFLFSLIAFISILFGSIGGLFQKRDNNLIAYSSILNLGFILLLISKLFMNYSFNLSNYKDTFEIIYNIQLLGGIIDQNKIIILFQFFFTYLINIIGVFAALSLFKRSSNLSVFKGFFLQPWFFFCFIINIFSLIGLPPFAGFYAKLYFAITILQDLNNIINSYNIFFVILALILSSFIYLKFLFPTASENPSSNILVTLDKVYTQYSLLPNNKEQYLNILNTNKANYSTYILALSTIFSILYPFIVVLILPFLHYFSI